MQEFLKPASRCAGALLGCWLALAGAALGQTDALLASGDLGGASGDLLTLPLLLTNADPVKGLQADLVYDPDLLVVRGAAAADRGQGMTLAWERVAAGRLRLVLFWDDAGSLPAGSGTVAEVAVTLVGPGGASGPLTPGDLFLADPEGTALPIVGAAGTVEILAAVRAPVVELAALPNPGRPRSLQVLVTVLDGSGAAPVVTAAGQPLTLTPLTGSIWGGRYDAGPETAAVTIAAEDTNAQGTGTALTLVTFDGEGGS